MRQWLENESKMRRRNEKPNGATDTFRTPPGRGRQASATVTALHAQHQSAEEAATRRIAGCGGAEDAGACWRAATPRAGGCRAGGWGRRQASVTKP